MYPAGGVIRGYVEAGRSFFRSGFLEEARRALGDALAAHELVRQERVLRPGERRAVEEARELMASLVGSQRRGDDGARASP
jgi:hypothetical protein